MIDMSLLVLTRRVGETICIGDDTAITVVAASGSRVLLAITAPRSIRVMRSELLAPEDLPAGIPTPAAKMQNRPQGIDFLQAADGR